MIKKKHNQEKASKSKIHEAKQIKPYKYYKADPFLDGQKPAIHDQDS